MSHAQPELIDEATGDRNYEVLFWVIGGCWGDESRSWRRWSEVCGPFLDRSQAEGLRRRLLAIYAGEEPVHFEVVRREDDCAV